MTRLKQTAMMKSRLRWKLLNRENKMTLEDKIEEAEKTLKVWGEEWDAAEEDLRWAKDEYQKAYDALQSLLEEKTNVHNTRST